MIEVIGMIAGSLTTISFVPQILKIWKSRSAEEVSGLMFSLFSLGVFLWLVYGILMRNFPIILFNSITLILSLSVLYFKIKFYLESKKR